MKPLKCFDCGYLEKFDTSNGFCMKTNRLIEEPNQLDEECPLNEKNKIDDANKKGFYLVYDSEAYINDLDKADEKKW